MESNIYISDIFKLIITPYIPVAMIKEFMEVQIVSSYKE